MPKHKPGEPYIAKEYTNFQMIGYEVSTGGPAPVRATSDFALEYEVPEDEYGAAYLPVEGVTNEDARIRLKRLAAVVDLARKSNPIRVSSKVPDRKVVGATNMLKVFMVPEFYFRPAASIAVSAPYKTLGGKVIEPTGGKSVQAYSSTTKDEIVSALKTMFAHGYFTDWLIVAGSIIWVEETREEYLGRIRDLQFVRNTALVVKGGHPGGEHMHMVDKLNFSSGDAVDLEGRPDVKLKDLIGEIAERRKAIFAIDNCKFGIEICRDHALSLHVLKKTYIKIADEPGPAKSEIDFHLLISAGMPLKPTSVAARVGGYVLREDGKAGSSYKPNSQVKKLARQTYTDIREIDDFVPDRKYASRDAFVAGEAHRLTALGEEDVTFFSDAIPEKLRVSSSSGAGSANPERIVWSTPIRI